MTQSDDVIRQVQATLNDPLFPPTLRQREILSIILYQVGRERTEDAGGMSARPDLPGSRS